MLYKNLFSCVWTCIIDKKVMHFFLPELTRSSQVDILNRHQSFNLKLFYHHVCGTHKYTFTQIVTQDTMGKKFQRTKTIWGYWIFASKFEH